MSSDRPVKTAIITRRAALFGLAAAWNRPSPRGSGACGRRVGQARCGGQEGRACCSLQRVRRPCHAPGSQEGFRGVLRHNGRYIGSEGQRGARADPHRAGGRAVCGRRVRKRTTTTTLQMEQDRVFDPYGPLPGLGQFKPEFRSDDIRLPVFAIVYGISPTPSGQSRRRTEELA